MPKKYARPLFNQLMIDIETLGTNPQSPIISIGAVLFCIKSGKIGKKFYQNVIWDIDRFKPDASTLQWWMQQPEAARYAVLSAIQSIDEALLALRKFIYKSKTEQVWANAPSFDCVILRNAFSVCKQPCPWEFWREMDYRTARNSLAGERFIRTEPRIKHYALYDAEAQAIDIIKFYSAKTGQRHGI